MNSQPHNEGNTKHLRLENDTHGLNYNLYDEPPLRTWVFSIMSNERCLDGSYSSLLIHGRVQFVHIKRISFVITMHMMFDVF